LMLMSGIFFDYKQVVLKEHHHLFLLNPMANLLENYRQVLMDGNSPDWLALGLIALTSTFVIYLMLLLYRKLDTKYAMMLSQ